MHKLPVMRQTIRQQQLSSYTQDISEFVEIQNELDVLGKMINSFIKYVESDWRT